MNPSMVIGSCLVLWCACAGTGRPPAALVQAREAYATAERSGEVRYDPAALYMAQMSLQRAEALYRDHADPQHVADASYIAMRQAQLAEVEGSIAKLKLDKLDLERAGVQQVQAKQSATQRAAREQPNPESAHADRALAELRRSSALPVTEQFRSTLITLPGAALFRPDEWGLLASSHAELDRVARALREQGERRILVVSYTDEAGEHGYNVDLSRRRAEAVAEYLAARGVPRNKLITRGMGPNNPVASNSTEAGREANTRVEISVQLFE
ncbi:MAG TPA: OmpA family protein [Polyangiales bacterium]|nr:OmpA family protein [Polyangiales bacterium]